MPIYRWQCFKCGLQFDAGVPISKRHEKQPCPECKAPSERAMPDKVEGFFDKKVTGPGPQNTGLSQLDAHIDRTIGAHAKQGWDAQLKRLQDKRKVMAKTGASGEKLSKNLDGSYRVLDENEHGVHDRALKIHNLAMKKAMGHEDPPSGDGSPPQ